jgi:hypothetical protein
MTLAQQAQNGLCCVCGFPLCHASMLLQERHTKVKVVDTSTRYHMATASWLCTWPTLNATGVDDYAVVHRCSLCYLGFQVSWPYPGQCICF